MVPGSPYTSALLELYRRKQDPQTYLGFLRGLIGLPQRAATSVQRYINTGEYDPAPIMQAASLAVGSPGVPAGALGSSIGRVARIGQAARTERFNWPVRTEYGKVIDMPITVNPSRGDIMRELANAPHGDVRALRAPDGKIYMWPANEAMHRDIATNFDLPFKTLKDLQSSSYLFNRADVDKLSKFSNFDEMIKLLSTSQ